MEAAPPIADAGAVFHALWIALGLGFILFAVYRVAWQRKHFAVLIKSSDELSAILIAAKLASQRLQINRRDTRLRYALSLWMYNVPLFCRIPKSELDILAPFIDLIIEGKGPPLNLPNEYRDWRPEVLAKFKQRMIDERLWPSTLLAVQSAPG